jgi:cholesterol transport system auxiliary component
MPAFMPFRTAALLLALAGGLSGCATPSAPVEKTVYDFGAVVVKAATDSGKPAATPLAMADIHTAWGQSSTAMQYRLAYANEQALQPYALARWSMPPAQLVAQQVRAVLSQQRPVVALGESQTAYALQLSLEEFGQSFEAPNASQSVVHLRATLLKGDQFLAQRDFAASVPATTPDAPGGVRALSLATQAVAKDLSNWLAQTAP